MLTLLENGLLFLLVIRAGTEFFADWTLPLGLLTLNPSIVVLLLSDAFALVYLGWLWRRGRWVWDRIGTALVLWILSLGPWVYWAAWMWGSAGLTGVREWARLWSLALLYLSLYALTRRRGYQLPLNVGLLAVSFPLVLSLVQTFFDSARRAQGAMVHPNNFATFMVVMIALTVWKLVQTSGWLRLSWAALLAAELLALITAVSSNSWLMLGVFLASFALLSPGRKARAIGVAVGLSFLLLFLVISLESPFLGKFRIKEELVQAWEVLGFGDPTSPTRGGTIGFRFEIWKGLVRAWQRHPLMGYGLNTAAWVNPVAVGKAAHNDFVRYLVEAGVGGLALFFLLQVAVGHALWRLRRAAAESQARQLANLVLALYFAWVVGSAGDNLIGFTVFQVYFWAVLAITTAALSSGTVAVSARTSQGFRFPMLDFSWAIRRRFPKPPTATPSSPSVVSGRDTLQPFSRLGRVALGLLTVAVVSLIGFYLWNQGASLRTFFLGWFLWYLGLVVVLKETPRYPAILVATFLVGLALLPVLGENLSQGIRQVGLWAQVAVGGWLVLGLGMSWRGSRGSGASRGSKGWRLFLRGYVVVAGALVGAAWALDRLLEAVSAFMGGQPEALGWMGLWSLTLFALLLLIGWGAGLQPFVEAFKTVFRSALGFVLLIHLGVWFSAALLWGMAQTFQAIPAFNRFAPLLHTRALGLYTWVSLGVFMGLSIGLVYRSSRLRSGKGRTITSFALRSRR